MASMSKFLAALVFLVTLMAANSFAQNSKARPKPDLKKLLEKILPLKIEEVDRTRILKKDHSVTFSKTSPEAPANECEKAKWSWAVAANSKAEKLILDVKVSPSKCGQNNPVQFVLCPGEPGICYYDGMIYQVNKKDAKTQETSVIVH